MSHSEVWIYCAVTLKIGYLLFVLSLLGKIADHLCDISAKLEYFKIIKDNENEDE